MNNSVIPEQGQLVSVRSRKWVVNDVKPSNLPAKSLFDTSGPEHLMGLSSIEDDALGEELQVIWELEPGARALDSVCLLYTSPSPRDATLSRMPSSA